MSERMTDGHPHDYKNIEKHLKTRLKMRSGDLPAYLSLCCGSNDVQDLVTILFKFNPEM